MDRVEAGYLVMVKAFWQQLPHTSAVLGALVLVLLAVRFPADEGTHETHESAQAHRKESIAMMVLLLVLLVLRVAYAFQYRVDSDESQHLHVVWGWTQGLLPYRDVFDNHMPLFQLLCAPLLAVLGERADILPLMRLVMIPLYAVTLWGTYRLGRTLFSVRVGRWAAVFTGLLPGFFFCAVEFRTDDLWTALWVVALAVLVEGQLTLRRSFFVGVLLGAALSVSMKTTLLLGSLGAATLGAVAVAVRSGERFPARVLFRTAFAAIAGLLLMPSFVIGFFAAHGAWSSFWYDTIQHNVLPGMGHWHRPYPFLLLPVLLALLWRGACCLVRSTPDLPLSRRRVLIFLASAGYATALFCLWPLWTREDYLPFYPLFVMFVTAFMLRVADRVRQKLNVFRGSASLSVQMLPMVISGVEVLLLVLGGPVWRNKAEAQTTLLADVLRLTGPTDAVVDVKGETVFRPRASFYVLEGITRRRILYRLLPDDIPTRLVTTHTCVAVGDDYRFPAETRAFLRDNYLQVGSLRVAGRLLHPTAHDRATVPFTITIPARYAIVAEQGLAAGWLDGTPYEGARLLAPGHHEFRSTMENERVAVIWAQALERGFSPFDARPGIPLQLTQHARH